METCAIVDVIGLFTFYDPAENSAPRVELTDFGRGLQVLAAPIDPGAGWILQLSDPDQAVLLQNFIISGGQLYLHPAC
ncbi:MAG: hypothetical protein MUF87_20050 [Anaerolineae bacterium]|jgi:hypothetical protein|nr:hypothetical protein [Anaerolineae bacterium]